MLVVIFISLKQIVCIETSYALVVGVPSIAPFEHEEFCQQLCTRSVRSVWQLVRPLCLESTYVDFAFVCFGLPSFAVRCSWNPRPLTHQQVQPMPLLDISSYKVCFSQLLLVLEFQRFLTDVCRSPPPDPPPMMDGGPFLWSHLGGM